MKYGYIPKRKQKERKERRKDDKALSSAGKKVETVGKIPRLRTWEVVLEETKLRLRS